MAKKEEVSFWTDADISAIQAQGQKLRDNPRSIIPPLVGRGQRPETSGRDVLLSALMGLKGSMAASQQAAQLGDPVLASLAAIGGAAGQPGPDAIAMQREEMARQQQLAQFEAMPVEAVSPDLVAQYPQLKGIPLGIVNKIAPFIKSHSDMEEMNRAKTDYYKALTGDVPERQADRDYKQRERRSGERTKVLEKFNADKSVVKAQQSIDAANTIRGLVDSNNPIAAAAIPTFMARASGEVGALSEADKAPFGGSQALIEKLEAALTQKAAGKLTPENARFITELAGIMEKRAASNMDLLARSRASQYAKASDFINGDDIYAMLRPESSALSSPGVIRRMGKPRGYAQSIPLISMDGGKTWSPE